MDIIKPLNDERIFEYRILDNNIKCIFINDKTLDKSYIATSVNVGSFANKEYYDGIAHLLEHMCFITSNKYKEKGFLAKKIAESGGFTNAYTAENNTIYYLDIFSENLEEILEIFVDFLTNAELKKEYILNELENVNSEHQKNLLNDNWRRENLEKILGDDNSNYNGFFTGSNETLNKSDIYEKIVDFYKKYYISSNISVCISSNYDINKLYKIINKSFGSITKSNVTNQVKIIKPFYNKNKGKQYIMKSIGSVNELEYLFETPENIIESKIFNLFINILCSPEENLCVDHLKSLGYINYIIGGYELYGLVKIIIKLTDEGIKNVIYVDNYMCNFFNKILEFNWNEIFKNEKKKNLFLFNNLSKNDILDLCTDLLIKLPIYNSKYIYIADYFYNNITDNDIAMLKECIDINKSVRILLTNSFNNNNNKTLIDPYYKTEYYETTMFYNNKNLNIDPIKYNLINPYDNMKPLYIKNLNIIPYKIKKNFWYGATSKFKEYNVYCNITFGKNAYYESDINYLLTNISIDILNYYLYKNFYKAVEYNFIAVLNANKNLNSIELNLYTFNDIIYMQKFIDDIFDFLFNNIKINDITINSFISSTKNNIKNINILNSWDFCDYIFNNSYQNSYYYLDLLKKIEEIDIKQIKNYITNLFNDTARNIFVYGNIKNLPNFNKLNIKNQSYTFPKILIKKNIIINNPNIDETTNCVKISYFTGKFDPLINLHLLFIRSITQNIFFEDLRTTKKLGYLVTMYSSIIGKEYYIYQKIQSEFSCDEIIENIKIFNNNLIDIIKKEDLNKWKKTIDNYLNEKEVNINELYNKYYNEISKKTYLFDRNKIMLKYINNISINSLIDFINEYIINNKKKNIIQIKCKILRD